MDLIEFNHSLEHIFRLSELSGQYHEEVIMKYHENCARIQIDGDEKEIQLWKQSLDFKYEPNPMLFDRQDVFNFFLGALLERAMKFYIKNGKLNLTTFDPHSKVYKDIITNEELL